MSILSLKGEKGICVYLYVHVCSLVCICTCVMDIWYICIVTCQLITGLCPEKLQLGDFVVTRTS